MGLGDVSGSVIPKPVLVSAGDDRQHLTSRYFTPRRCHTSHAVTGAIGVATAFALPGTVAGEARPRARDARRRRAAPAGPHRGQVEVAERRRRGRGHAARRWSAPPARSCRAISTCPTTCSRRPHRPRTDRGHRHGRGRAVPAARHDDRADLGRWRQRRHRPRHRPNARPAASGGPSPSTTGPARTVRSPASTWPEPDPDGTPSCSATSPPTGCTPPCRPSATTRSPTSHRSGSSATPPRSSSPDRPCRPGPSTSSSRTCGRHPEAYTYASAGEGTAPHFAAELFKLDAGVDDRGPHLRRILRRTQRRRRTDGRS